jgi:hypothetical protein
MIMIMIIIEGFRCARMRLLSSASYSCSAQLALPCMAMVPVPNWLAARRLSQCARAQLRKLRSITIPTRMHNYSQTAHPMQIDVRAGSPDLTIATSSDRKWSLSCQYSRQLAWTAKPWQQCTMLRRVILPSYGPLNLLQHPPAPQ